MLQLGIVTHTTEPLGRGVERKSNVLISSDSNACHTVAGIRRDVLAAICGNVSDARKSG